MNKKITALILLLLAFCFNFKYASAEQLQQSDDTQEIYNQLYRESGADELFDKLPDDAKKSFSKAGIDGSDVKSLANLNVKNIFYKLALNFKESLANPLKILTRVLAVLILCSLIYGFNLSIEKSSMQKILSICATLFICIIILKPIIKCIYLMSLAISSSCAFMLTYVPIQVGLIAASGQSLSAYSFNLIMLSALAVISKISSAFVVPLLNSFLAVSVSSSISPNLNLESITEIFSSISKWTLGIITTVFAGIVSIENIVASAADGFNNKAAKFAISNFVPIVGKTLSESFSTLQSCVKLLKSGIGAFAIIGVVVIFLPSVVQCVVWIFCTKIGKAFSTILGFSNVSNLFESINKVMVILFSCAVSCIAIFLFSTFLIISITGGSS